MDSTPDQSSCEANGQQQPSGSVGQPHESWANIFHHVGPNPDRDSKCGICFVEIGLDEEVLRHSSCGNNWHLECIKLVFEPLERLDQDVTCPNCRGLISSGIRQRVKFALDAEKEVLMATLPGELCEILSPMLRTEVLQLIHMETTNHVENLVQNEAWPLSAVAKLDLHIQDASKLIKRWFNIRLGLLIPDSIIFYPYLKPEDVERTNSATAEEVHFHQATDTSTATTENSNENTLVRTALNDRRDVLVASASEELHAALHVKLQAQVESWLDLAISKSMIFSQFEKDIETALSRFKTDVKLWAEIMVEDFSNGITDFLLKYHEARGVFYEVVEDSAPDWIPTW